ncbi:eukaryotic porin-domain-containing protein [Dipodascopsis uninucleata]
MDKFTENIQLGLSRLPFEKMNETLRTTPGFSHVLSLYDTVAQRRSYRGLTTPVKFEDFSREVEKDVLPTLFMFQGLRADVSQNFNLKPMFNTMSSFAVGSGRDTSYSFNAMWGSDVAFLRGSLDNELNVSAHAAFRSAANVITRVQAQSSSRGTQVVTETDISGPDFMLNLRATNPSFIDIIDARSKTQGAFELMFSQSITRNLALGITGAWHRQQADQPANALLSAGGRYQTDSWIGTALLSGQGVLQSTYWQKLTDRVQAGVLCQLDLLGGTSAMASMFGGEAPPSATTALGLKVEYSDAMVRTQLDSTGKIALVIDKMLQPTVKMSIASELDHAKNSCKIGLNLQFEMASESYEMQMQQLNGLDREAARVFMADPPQ